MKKRCLCLFLFLSFSLTTQSFARVRFICSELSFFKPKKQEIKHYFLTPSQLQAFQNKYSPLLYEMHYTFLESQEVISSLMKKMAKNVGVDGAQLILKRENNTHSLPVIVGDQGLTFPRLKNLIKVDLFQKPSALDAPSASKHISTYTILNEQALSTLMGKKVRFKVRYKTDIYEGVVIDSRPSLPSYGLYENHIEGEGPEGIFLTFRETSSEHIFSAHEVDSSRITILEVLETP